MIGRPAAFLLPPNIPSELLNFLNSLRSDGNSRSYKALRKCKDGTTIEVSVTLSLIRDPLGKVIGASKQMEYSKVSKEIMRIVERCTLESTDETVMGNDINGVSSERCNSGYLSFS